MTVRREISSTLGLNTAIRELPVRASLLSQGDSFNVLLKTNFCSVAKASPNVKPSDFFTVVSVQGENTRLSSLACTTAAATAIRRSRTAAAGERSEIAMIGTWNFSTEIDD